jgi:hypothetical protein
MLIKKPYQNEDIPTDFFMILSKIPDNYRTFHEMYIFHNSNTLVIDYPIRILIALNKDLSINVYDSGIVIINNFSIIQLSDTRKLTITI